MKISILSSCALYFTLSLLISGCGVKIENLCRYKSGCLTPEPKPKAESPLVFKAESIAIHFNADHGSQEYALPVSENFIEPRSRFFIRITLPQNLQPASVVDGKILLFTEHGSFVPNYYRVSGNQIEIEASQFGVVGVDTTLHKRICLNFEGLVDLQGNPIPKFGIRLSRLPGDSTGDGVVNLGDYYHVGENHRVSLVESSALEVASKAQAGMIRSDLDLNRFVGGEDQTHVLHNWGAILSQSEPFPRECMSVRAF